jgi:hypothetical protein
MLSQNHPIKAWYTGLIREPFDVKVDKGTHLFNACKDFVGVLYGSCCVDVGPMLSYKTYLGFDVIYITYNGVFVGSK